MNTNPHSNHRERLRARFLSSPDSFEDHELLELILFYSIPRVNTNETAHALLDRFGSLKGVLDAGLPALKSVNGIGENSAIYLRAISELLLRYERANAKVDSPLRSKPELAAYLRSLFVGTESEISYVIMFDASKRVILCQKLSEGYSAGNVISMREIVSLALNSNAAGMILAHNHPSGKAIPSGEDIEATNLIRGMLDKLGVQLIDHFIVAGKEVRPIINYHHADLYNMPNEEKK